MGDVIHISPAENSRLPPVMTDMQVKALRAIQGWLDGQPDGDAYLTHHSMDTNKFELVDLMVKFAEVNGTT